MLTRGDVIGGKYRLIDPLGEVIFSDFHLDGERLIESFGAQLTDAPLASAP